MGQDGTGEAKTDLLLAKLAYTQNYQQGTSTAKEKAFRGDSRSSAGGRTRGSF